MNQPTALNSFQRKRWWKITRVNLIYFLLPCCKTSFLLLLSHGWGGETFLWRSDTGAVLGQEADVTQQWKLQGSGSNTRCIVQGMKLLCSKVLSLRQAFGLHPSITMCTAAFTGSWWGMSWCTSIFAQNQSFSSPHNCQRELKMCCRLVMFCNISSSPLVTLGFCFNHLID